MGIEYVPCKHGISATVIMMSVANKELWLEYYTVASVIGAV